jgi:hypothetical protein
LSEKQPGDKKFSTYFNCGVLKLLLLLMLQSGGLNFAVNEAGSGGSMLIYW